MSDSVIEVSGSVIQHGPFNDRVYLMKAGLDNISQLPSMLEEIVQKYGYSKIFSKIPAFAKKTFVQSGHIEEARIPGFFKGEEAAVFMAKYLSNERMEEKNAQERSNVLEVALSKSGKSKDIILADDEEFTVCSKGDATEMARLYAQVFPSYPFPIQDARYLVNTMSEDFVYFGIRKRGDLVAVSSCEMDVLNLNVEMTDFATLPDSRGKGYSYLLLGEMEKNMRSRGILTSYTIARAISYGINTIFSRRSYTYGGTLLNNTNISGGIESMNIWYKTL